LPDATLVRTVSPEKIDYLLKEAGIAFLFAPTLHPAMGAVMHIRKELATPTIFNYQHCPICWKYCGYHVSP
jgi:anthranilate phosphoribosyltransferase